MKEMTLVHRGSTKDVYQSGEHYIFRFSDRYSVFDWGEMPDQLEHKGPALARFTKILYAHLQQHGIKTHWIDTECEDNQMVVRPFEVIRTGGQMPKLPNIFIPLEVIFRLGVARGSSLLKRPGFQELQRFERPMVEFTTKLERIDRPLTHAEAQELSGMNPAEWQCLLDTTLQVASLLEELLQQHQIVLWDGKLEFALGEYQGADRAIILVDSIGPDELRLTKDDVQLSKEVIRQYYRGSEWYQKLEAAKKTYGADFKNHLPPPAELPADFKQAVEQMYQLMPALIGRPGQLDGELERLLPLLRERGA
jgi:phosphoribosylaminoimidazole-succinocarboxamide synthase